MPPKKKNADGENGEVQLVPRELTSEDVEQRRLRLSELTIDIQDLEDQRREQASEITAKLKKLKKEARALATAVKSGVELVDAQLSLLEAKQSRRTVVRHNQDMGAEVEP